MNISALIILATGLIIVFGAGIWKRDILVSYVKKPANKKPAPIVGPSFKTVSYLGLTAGQKLGPASALPIVATYGGAINAVR